ncbi:MAG: aldehyde dehydrogenase family protein [Marinoscillum sp.]
MKIINPATEAVITQLPEDTKLSIHEKLHRLRLGQQEWAQRSVSDRLAVIEKFGNLVTVHKEELAQVLTSETGKPISQARGEVSGSLNRITHLATNAEKWLATEIVATEGVNESISYEPLGVIANISAWNFPYNVGYNVFVYALTAGNAVMYKPSEFASLTGLKFRALLLEAGVPENVFEVVIGSGKEGQYMLDADLDGYFFTGSYQTGVHIARTVAQKLVPLQLELGGKDPLYIMDDVADIRQAAINAAEGAFYNNGQSCCAVERIYVQEAVYEEFVQCFIEEVKSYKIGDPLNEETFCGPLTRKPQIDTILHQVQDAMDNGAQLLMGGDRPEKTGYYLNPTVLTNVNHDMEVMKEESFGPIIGIQKVGSDEEAAKLMQDTLYGLTAAVFSASKERAKKILDQMNVGTVYWNCCDRVSPDTPWSGRKNSGLGSTLSYQGIRAFTQPKSYQMRG